MIFKQQDTSNIYFRKECPKTQLEIFQLPVLSAASEYKLILNKDAILAESSKRQSRSGES